jgi:rRNA-processing protein FCF1
MKTCILDTNFIIGCVKQKIDFFDELESMGLEAVVPEQVIAELERLSKKSEDARLAYKILENGFYTKKKLTKKFADNAILEYARSNKSAIVATLDRELRKKLKNKILVIRGKKKLEIL